LPAEKMCAHGILNVQVTDFLTDEIMLAAPGK